MFDYSAAALYGVIQGITEFLPVSSSAHLALIPHLTTLQDPGVFFDLSMHFGTAMSVFLIYRHEILHMLKNPFGKASQNLIFVTFITGLLGLALEKQGELWRAGPQFMAANLIFFGLLMGASYFYRQKRKPTFSWETIPLFPHLFIFGLAQALAVLPGVSRSGITITAALFLGMNLSESTRGSFLFSLPLILAGMLLKGLKLWKNPESVAIFSPSILATGIAISFIVGLLAMTFMREKNTKIGLYPYMIYRLILGITLLSLL
jgi:undecaprenyl-diphosphatase